MKLKASRRKKLMVRAEKNEIENRKSIEKINETKLSFFEKYQQK